MILIRGTVKGVKQIDRVNKKTGEVITKHFVGISFPKENGYHDEEVIIDIQVSNKQLHAGLAAHYEGHRGKEVFVPVFPSAWASQAGNAGISWFFSGDGRPTPVEPVRVGATKAAS